MQRIYKLTTCGIVAMLLLCAHLSAAPTHQSAQQHQLDSITNVLRQKDQQISALEDQIEFLCKKQSAEVELINQSNQNLSNELDASGRIVSIWGFVISIVAMLLGGFIGIFVTIKYNQLKKISKVVNQAKQTTIDSLQKTRKTYDLIIKKQSKLDELAEKTNASLDDAISQVTIFKELYSDFRAHSSEIYQQMRREETKDILRHLVDIPEDVSNVLTLLLSRTLEPCDFDILTQAFNKLTEQNKRLADMSDTPVAWVGRYASYAEDYALLYYQHFCGEAICNDSLKDFMLEHMDFLCRCAFLNDMLKSTRDLKAKICSLSKSEQLLIQTKYVVACAKTEYKDEPKVYEIILDGMSTDDVLSLWRSCSAKITDAITFSNVVKRLLLSSGVSPSSSDIAEIDTYITKGTK